jgi:hypothetical protein
VYNAGSVSGRGRKRVPVTASIRVIVGPSVPSTTPFILKPPMVLPNKLPAFGASANVCVTPVATFG